MPPLERLMTRSTSKLLSLALAALILSACSSSIPPSLVRPPLPADLQTPCPPLPVLSDGRTITIERALIGDAHMYYDCADKLDALVAAVKEPLTLP